MQSPAPTSSRPLPAPLDRSKPVWVAPMAGGPSTPRLVIAAARAGHFAQLAAGYTSAEAMTREVREVRAAGTELFGVNLFVPNVHPITAEANEVYARSLAPTAARLHHEAAPVALREDDDAWDAKIAALVAEPVPVVSFTFGLPSAAVLEALRRAGSVLVQTVTSSQEARRAEAAGVDAVLVQGFAAGGHSGVWDADASPADVPLPQLVEEVAGAVSLPLVAAGGIASSRDVELALAAGASAVTVGTAVLRTPESGASDLHKNALADPQYTSTTHTRAFTGRPARALVNRFVLDHDKAAPSGYPALHHLTRPLRAAAVAANDSSALNLWAGEQWRHATSAPVAEVLGALLSAGERMGP
ncbi:nitronate monooxygenase [Aeromicrobium choanae]|uniref:Propionate 3-nitronate monooxygenase n=1 Tax=Aeromicrobium choanae TaxID=1736691 RepID=A0A1T4Z8I5_9ACTN|nr:nitronate monooxygenase [Aeromicrobium choanae]SKB10387.1 nitroalkane oxidase [Aeromicrobium choanae]